MLLIRAVEEIKYPRWRRILLPHSRRDEVSISRYVRFIATKKAAQKTSKMGVIYFFHGPYNSRDLIEKFINAPAIIGIWQSLNLMLSLNGLNLIVLSIIYQDLKFHYMSRS